MTQHNINTLHKQAKEQQSNRRTNGAYLLILLISFVSSPVFSSHKNCLDQAILMSQGVQRRMISVDNFFAFLRLLFFALLLLSVT